MVQAIELPSVVVTRVAAEDLIKHADLPHGGSVVKLLARGVASSSQSFADEVVQQLLSSGYHTAIVLGAPRQLLEDLDSSAKRAGNLQVTTSEVGLIAS